MPEKYVGSMVDIIYMDRLNKITKRRIKVLSIGNGKIKALCQSVNAYRVFSANNVLAVEPVKQRAI